MIVFSRLPTINGRCVADINYWEPEFQLFLRDMRVKVSISFSREKNCWEVNMPTNPSNLVKLIESIFANSRNPIRFQEILANLSDNRWEELDSVGVFLDDDFTRSYGDVLTWIWQFYQNHNCDMAYEFQMTIIRRATTYPVRYRLSLLPSDS